MPKTKTTPRMTARPDSKKKAPKKNTTSRMQCITANQSANQQTRLVAASTSTGKSSEVSMGQNHDINDVDLHYQAMVGSLEERLGEPPEARYVNMISSKITNMDELDGATKLLKEMHQGYRQKSVSKSNITKLLETVSINVEIDNDLKEDEISQCKYDFNGKSSTINIAENQEEDILALTFTTKLLRRMYNWKKHKLPPRKPLHCIRELDAVYKFLFSDMRQFGWEWQASNFIFDGYKHPPDEYDPIVIFQKMFPSHCENESENNDELRGDGCQLISR